MRAVKAGPKPTTFLAAIRLLPAFALAHLNAGLNLAGGEKWRSEYSTPSCLGAMATRPPTIGPLPYGRGSGVGVSHHLPPTTHHRFLNIVVQRELVGMRAQANRIGFVLALVVYERFDQIFAEHIALQQKFVIFFETGQRLFE